MGKDMKSLSNIKEQSRFYLIFTKGCSLNTPSTTDKRTYLLKKLFDICIFAEKTRNLHT